MNLLPSSIPGSETLYVRIRDDGFYYERGQADHKRVVENLTQIKKVLENNILFSISKINEHRKIVRFGGESKDPRPPSSLHVQIDLFKQATKDRDNFTRYLSSVKITERVGKLLDEEEKINQLFNNIHSLIPKYRTASYFHADAIKMARSLGWEGDDDNVLEFLNDFEKTIKDLVDQKIISQNCVIRINQNIGLKIFFPKNSKIDLYNTFIVIAKKKLNDDVNKLAERYLKKDKSNQIVQLGLIFYKKFYGDLSLEFFYRARACGAVNSMHELAPYCTDDYGEKLGLKKIFEWYGFLDDLLKNPLSKTVILELLERRLIKPEQLVEKIFSGFHRHTELEMENILIPLLDKAREMGVNFKLFNIGSKWPLIFHALARESLNLLKYLILQKVDLEVKDPKGSTALQYAVENSKNPKLVDELITAGANVNSTDKYGTPMILSFSVLCNEAFFESFMKADVCYSAHKLLRKAINCRSPLPILKTIIALCVDINENELEISHLSYAIDLNHLVAATALLDAGAKILSNDLCKAVSKKNIAMIELLIERGADVNKSIDEATTPLVTAISTDDPFITKLLIEKGANIHVSRGILDYAVTCNKLRCLEVLINAGVNLKVLDEPLLFEAIRNLNVEAVRLLLAGGADPLEVHPKSNKSVREVAMGTGNQKIIALFNSKKIA